MEECKRGQFSSGTTAVAAPATPLSIWNLLRENAHPWQRTMPPTHPFRTASMKFRKPRHVGQRLDPRHRGERKLAVKMRKERAAARRFPFQRVAKRRRIDMHQQQIVLAREMLPRGFRDLGAG